MKILYFTFFIFLFSELFSQSKDSSITFPMFSGSYSFQIPAGDLDERFGNSSSIGPSFMIKTKQNILLGVDFDFIFGNKINQPGVFDSILPSNGKFINKYGEFAKVLISERGFFLGGKIGKIIPIFKSNPNSGILITVRAGLLQHKIRIDNEDNNVPQILEDYKKGYDRLTNGFSVSEFIGYMYFSKSQFANFYAGFEFYQAWTENRRTIDFATMKHDEMQRKDYLYTIKVGLIIPIRKRSTNVYYLN
ncbi:MAG: hypothetical protein A2046_02200 [Bacteroidetes bacterium GWA2_30_7]|nr:MAG: hypothetical protein A2046_02200 [Bacteroidetes bacterium GWA2_30_7]